MKVGIVTFHRAHNFGAVLQCFALKNVLENLGHEVDVIDHRNSHLEKPYHLFPHGFWKGGLLSSFKSVISDSITLNQRHKRITNFNSFIGSHLLPRDSKTDIWNGYDCIVWGSDQIWQWNIIHDDKCFWGEVPNKTVRKVTYAASSGKINKHFEDNLPLLSNFNAISVREKDLHDYLSEKGIQTKIVLDPTLLLEKSDWERLLPLNNLERFPYLLVYAMRNRKNTLKIARKVSQETGLRIVEIFNNYISPRYIFQKYCHADPIKFLSLFSNADYVVTDSFHGTAFSIIFNRQFITVKHNDGHDNRAESLLLSVGLTDRHKQVSDYITLPTIDYAIPNSLWAALREDSVSFLKDNINFK